MSVELDDADTYRKHADDLTRFATGLVGPTHAQDLVSEAVLKSMSAKGWRTVADKRAYLFRSVYNESLRLHRSASRRKSREQRAATREQIVVPDAPRPEVLSAVWRLSPRQRAVIVLTYWDDLDPVAVAKVLKISEGSVRRHLARARAHLKETLNDQ